MRIAGRKRIRKKGGVEPDRQAKTREELQQELFGAAGEHVTAGLPAVLTGTRPRGMNRLPPPNPSLFPPR